MADRETVDGHYFVKMQQGPAICLYCDNCNDPKCCPQDTCKRTILEGINRTIAKLRRRAK